MVKKVIKTIRRYSMFERKDKVLVCVSGGPDSVCLLHILNSLKEYLRIKISVAHFNHKLRRESDAEENFVRALSKDLGFAFYTEYWKEKPSANIQKEARRVRYSFFLKTVKEIGAERIALGHNLNDSAETVLFHIIRGERPVGICPKREEEGVQIVRPLIEIERAEIEEYLKAYGIDYCIDHTNLEPLYTRNKIRLEVLPELEKLNPDILRALVKVAKVSERERDFLHREAERADVKGEKGISIEKLKSLHPALSAHILKREGMNFSQIEEVLSMLNKKRFWKVDLGNGRFAQREGNSLVLS
jgi:tRNA(Ile)-lysidine synthase